MRKLVTGVGIAALLLVGGTVVAAGKRANVKVVNRSDWEIHHLYMQPTTEKEWGPDQLGEHVIDANGGTFTLSDVPCDTYDIKLVDEDGDECEVTKVDVCGKSQSWEITSKDLLACQGSAQ